MPPTNIEPPSQPIQPASLGSGRSLGIFQSIFLGTKALALNISTLILLALIPIVIGIITSSIQYFSRANPSGQTPPESASYIASNILSLLASSIIFAAVTFTVLAGLRNRKVSIVEAIRSGLKNIIRFSLIYIIIAVIIAPIIYILMMLMILPLSLFFRDLTSSPFGAGVVLIIGLPIASLLSVPIIGRLVFSYGLAVDHPAISAWSAIISSWKLSKGHTWKLAGILYVTIIPPAASFFIIFWYFAVSDLLTLGAIIPIALFFLIASLITYLVSLSALLALYNSLISAQQVIASTNSLTPPPTPPSENTPTNLSQTKSNISTPPLNSASSTPASDSLTEMPTEPQSPTQPKGSDPTPPTQSPPQT